MSGQVSSERVEEGIRLVRLARSEARNALTLEMIRSLNGIFDEITNDSGCRVIVLAADGVAFSAGLDLKVAVFGDEAPQGACEAIRLQEMFAGTVLKLRRMRQPVVAAVQGAAVGAGFGLALSADVRVAGTSAAFLVGAVKIGLSAGECGISYHLPRLVGAGRAFEIMLTGRPVSAGEALAIGLVSRVTEDARLIGEAVDAARMIAANSPYSVKHTKQVMWGNLEAPSLEVALELENHVQTVALLTEDFREGAMAFAEKRLPRFSGR
jgi:enoyl-CoA hydratase